MKPKMMPSASMVILLFPQGLEAGGARFKRGMTHAGRWDNRKGTGY